MDGWDYEREGLLTLTQCEADAEYHLLTLEEEQDKWLADLDFEDEEAQPREHFGS